MGTRINVLMDHTIMDYRDQAAILAPLDVTLPETIAVRNYWQSVGEAVREEQWIADLGLNYEKHYRSYTGAGSLFLKVGPFAAKIRTGGRWRGFLSIAPLRKVHLEAFRSIASALGATQLAYFPDCEDVWEVFYEGGTFGDSLPILERYFGQPQPSIEEVSSKIAEETENSVPGVWYLDLAPSTGPHP